jgi:hypothetical protein
MATCYVEFGGRGFWADDRLLEACLLLLVRRIDALPDVPDWVEEARDYWELQTVIGCGHALRPEFDDYLTSPIRRAFILRLVDTAFLDPFGMRKLDLWVEEWPATRSRQTTLYMALISLSPSERARLLTTATRLRWLLSGEPAENWRRTCQPVSPVTGSP